MKFKIGDRVKILSLTKSIECFGGFTNPNFMGTKGKIGTVENLGSVSKYFTGRVMVRCEGGSCYNYHESDLVLYNEKKESEKMIVIPGFENYSFDPATKRVWSNITQKWIKPYTGDANVYYLRADNSTYNRWTKKYNRVRIEVSEIMVKVGKAVDTSVGKSAPAVDTKTRGEYIVLKRNPVDGKLSMTETPRVYNSYEAAREGAAALAKVNKGTKYSVLEVKGTVVSGDVVWC